MSRSPLSTARTVWILTRMGARRLLNRLTSTFLRRRPAKEGSEPPKRTATPGKSRWGFFFLPALGLLFLPQGFFFSSQILSRISTSIDSTEQGLRSPFDAVPPAPAEVAKKLRGTSGFHVDWPAPNDEPRFLAAVSLVFLILWLAILFTTLGAPNQDLGNVEWGFEWLFTFPARARSLFFAKLLEYALLNAFTWLTVFPFAIILYLHAGQGWAAVLFAVAATFCLNLLLAAGRLLLETWLRKRFSLARVKNLQALFTLLGMLALYALLYVGIADRPPDWFSAAARAAPAIAWLPPALPAYIASRAISPWVPAAIMLLGTVVVSAGCVLLAAWLVREGLLLSGGGPFQGSRGKEVRPHDGRRLGIARKDALLLLRDRSFLVQTFVVPILIIGFQVIINRPLLDATSRDLRHGSAFAFGIGAYVLMFAGFSVLSSEGQGLWLLYTFPRPLSSVLRQKACLWAVISMSYVGVVLGILLLRSDVVDATSLPPILMALLGILIYAFVAAGLGVLGADPLAQHAHRKVRPGMAYLFMLLASMYAFGIYAPSPWQKIVLATLCALLAFAIWQKVEDRLPYLLDPTAAPPPRIALSDGLIAVLAFFVLQGLVGYVWVVASGVESAMASQGTVLVLGFVFAGSIVVCTALYSFWRLNVPDVLVAVGIRGEKDGRSSATGAVGQGIVLGAAAALFGVIYQEALFRLPLLEDLKRQVFLTDRSLEGDARWLIPVLAITAAPLFEEFIFRGLVYRGLRRSMPASLSILASAAIFAIVHPPPSVLPVFVLGLAAAVSFERTGLLAAPIMAHVTYNAAIVAAGLWRPGT